MVYESDVGESRFPFPARLGRLGLRSLVFAPLIVESKVFGVMIAARRAKGGFTSGECEFLRQLSGHVALAATRAGFMKPYSAHTRIFARRNRL